MKAGYKHLTPAMKRRIAKLTPTTTQRDIGLLLGVHRNTVHRAQRELGLTARPPRPSTRAILDLVDSGLSHAKTAKALGTAGHIVRYVCEKNNRRPGRHRPKPISEAKMQAVMNDILSGLYPGTEISRQNNFCYKKTMKLIHQVRQCERFIGNSKIPLDSYFPQKWPESKLGKKAEEGSRVDDTEANFIGLVDFITKHLDEAPQEPSEMARLLLNICLHYVPRQVLNSFTNIERQNVERYFSAHIGQALATLRQSENCAWKN
jgi:hypothetical protein